MSNPLLWDTLSHESLQILKDELGSQLCNSFEALAPTNPFLFLVYREGVPSRHPTHSPVEQNSTFHWRPKDGANAYEQFVTRMDIGKDVPLAITSFSFLWSLWEGIQQQRSCSTANVYMSIIDARQLGSIAVTAADVLDRYPFAESHTDFAKLRHFAEESQQVFIFEPVPESAFMCTVSLQSLLPHLPSYFPIVKTIQRNRLLDVPQPRFNYARKIEGYRAFCRELSSRFAVLTPVGQLSEASSGSVRLAMAFLRPYFLNVATKDSDGAVNSVTELACLIAQWPAQSWGLDQDELWTLVRSFAVVMANEVLEARSIRRGESEEPAQEPVQVQQEKADGKVHTTWQGHDEPMISAMWKDATCASVSFAIGSAITLWMLSGPWNLAILT